MIGNSFKRSFLHFFPIPKFLTEPAFGLDISDESLKFLELVRTRKGLSVSHHGEVKIPAGIEDGQSMRLTGMGEAIPFGTSGDLYVKVHVKPHSHIRKEGNNLITEQKIKLTQAIIGGDITLKSLDGDLIVSIPEGTNNGDVLRVKGKGVPHGDVRRGDLFIKITIDMPKKLSKDAKKAIEELKREGI
jgi:DnaJ-class molecular chaperone